MARFFKKRTESKGLAPGSLVFVGQKKVDKIEVSLMRYVTNLVEETELKPEDNFREKLESNKTNWLNIYGLHDLDFMKKIKEEFNLHALLVEDVLNTAQRPKFEEFDNHLLITLKMIRYKKESDQYMSEQLSMVLGEHYLLTLQEQPGDIFNPVRERIHKNKGRIRKAKSDYLAYALMDTIVDNNIYLIEELGERIESLEDHILDNPSKELLEKIYHYKREITYLAKVIRPVRDIITRMLKTESSLVEKETFQYIKDLQDLVVHSIETLDTYRDILADYFNLYHTNTSNKMNEIMKVLTIFAAIFIPLTFIAGIYGTNFKYLPELEYKYSYFIFWGVILVIGLGMLWIFKRRKWF